MEKIILENTLKHTKYKKAIVNIQHGFTKEKSYLTAFHSEIISLLHKGKTVDVILSSALYSLKFSLTNQRSTAHGSGL